MKTTTRRLLTLAQTKTETKTQIEIETETQTPAVPLSNGRCFTRTGHLCVLVDTTDTIWKPRPVLTEKRSGYQPDRCTVQVAPSVGDLLFSMTHQRDESEFSVQRWTETGWETIPLTADEYPSLWAKAELDIPWLDRFLTFYGRGPSCIPYEGLTICEQAKKNRLDRFFTKYALPYKGESFMKDPSGGLKLNPTPMPEGYIPSEYHWTGSVVSLNQYAKYFAVGKFGTRQLEIEPAYTSGSNYAHSGPATSSKGSPLLYPKGTTMIIRVGHGQYVRDHYSYGHTIDVWSVA